MEFLKVRGTKLYSENQEIVLHGVSSHGLSFYPEYVNEKTFTFFKDNWKINALGQLCIPKKKTASVLETQRIA